MFNIQIFQTSAEKYWKTYELLRNLISLNKPETTKTSLSSATTFP